jgi:hypothetical protein
MSVATTFVPTLKCACSFGYKIFRCVGESTITEDLY